MIFLFHTSLNEPLGSFILRGACVLFGAELQISGKFLRVGANLYLHTQREAKSWENLFNVFENFAVQTKHVYCGHAHIDYVFSYAF